MQFVCTFQVVKRLLLGTALVLLLTAPPAAALPPVKHVFIIVLENKDYEQSFGPDSKAPYLAQQLTQDGQLLQNYFGTSHRFAADKQFELASSASTA